MNVKNKIKDLVDTLNNHAYKYFVLSDPDISDAEYDIMYQELKKLEAKHPELTLEYSPTKRVGYQVQKEFKKLKLSEPMLSLTNIFSFDELLNFDKRIQKELGEKPNYTIEAKLDGLAVSIIYKNGILSKASTRGDAYIGEDVTENIKTIKNVPLKLKDNIKKDIEIRGEVLIPKHEFEKLNSDRINKGEKPFANARNCASGSLRQLDTNITAKRQLFFYAHSFTSKVGINSHYEALNYAQSLGFSVFKHYKLTDNLNEIEHFYNLILSQRENLEIEIDGIVIKVDDRRFQTKLGTIAKAPKWAVAWKPPANIKISKINNIILQVGRTGVLTPVADIEPTNIGGVVVKRASLHNASELERKDIRIGDYVEIERAGDVIPSIIKVIANKRKEPLAKFVFPTNCPICKSVLIKTDINFKCINKFCPAKVKETIIHFAKAINIDGLGEKLINKLVDLKIVNNFSDLYKLSINELANIDRMGRKSANNIYLAIQSSKNTTLAQFIFALGIDLVGIETAKELSKYFKTPSKMLNKSVSVDELTTINGIGPNIAQSVFSYFTDISNIDQINKLINCGFNFNEPGKELSTLQDLTFVITGSFNNYSRSEIKNIIESYSGVLSSTISKKTNYLIQGKNPSSKLEKAKNLNIKIISIEDFFNLLEKDENYSSSSNLDLFQK